MYYSLKVTCTTLQFTNEESGPTSSLHISHPAHWSAVNERTESDWEERNVFKAKKLATTTSN